MGFRRCSIGCFQVVQQGINPSAAMMVGLSREAGVLTGLVKTILHDQARQIAVFLVVVVFHFGLRIGRGS